METKKILTIQDISGYGQCSLTVALPVLSALGFETAVVPVAVLSGHGGFPEHSVLDLTEEIPKFTESWRKMGLKFSAVYTGWLANEKQIDYVIDLYNTVKKDDTLLIVDPCMADDGKFYKGFTKEYAKKMTDFCKNADVVCPNITEAEFMLGNSFVKKRYTDDEMKQKAALIAEGTKKKLVVITGIPAGESKIVTACYDYHTQKTELYYQQRIEGNYYGTGDIFASVLTGLILKNHTLGYSVKQAADFVAQCIRSTHDDRKSHWYGVHFEKNLKMLTEMK